MRVSKDPLAPLRSWKELILGTKPSKKVSRVRRPEPGLHLQTAHVGVGE